MYHYITAIQCNSIDSIDKSNVYERIEMKKDTPRCFISAFSRSASKWPDVSCSVDTHLLRQGQKTMSGRRRLFLISNASVMQRFDDMYCAVAHAG